MYIQLSIYTSLWLLWLLWFKKKKKSCKNMKIFFSLFSTTDQKTSTTHRYTYCAHTHYPNSV